MHNTHGERRVRTLARLFSRGITGHLLCALGRNGAKVGIGVFELLRCRSEHGYFVHLLLHLADPWCRLLYGVFRLHFTRWLGLCCKRCPWPAHTAVVRLAGTQNQLRHKCRGLSSCACSRRGLRLATKANETDQAVHVEKGPQKGNTCALRLLLRSSRRRFSLPLRSCCCTLSHAACTALSSLVSMLLTSSSSRSWNHAHEQPLEEHGLARPPIGRAKCKSPAFR